MELEVISMIITIIYLLIVLFFVVLLVWNLFESQSILEKALGSIVLVMLILRLLLIK